MCGCLGRKKDSKINKRRTVADKSKEPVCMDMYEELRELDLKVISLLKVTDDSILKQSNKQLRKWITDLKINCPDEYEYVTLKQYIEDEYSKYNT